MNSLFNVILTAVKSRINPLWKKFRLWCNPNYIRSVVFTRIHVFFKELFDIKPKNRHDYYLLFSWLICKKLAFTIVVLLGCVSLCMILTFHPFQGGSGTVRTFRYDSLPLKFQKGQVRILAENGSVAYVGTVEKGSTTGGGKLYGRDGNLIFEGNFDHNMFHGIGKLYYKEGSIRYAGSFMDNQYQGSGIGYWENGSKEYVGNYDQGMKSGEGELYNSGGTLIYTGVFSSDRLVYAQMIGKSTQEVGTMYSGRTQIYTSEQEFCVDMPEINAVYTAIDGSDSLEALWKVGRVYVLEDSFPLAGELCTDRKSLEALMGEPSYRGFTNMELAEAIGIRKLRQRGNVLFADPELECEDVFQDASQVTGYQDHYDLYMSVFEYDGLLYSFYGDKEGDSFAMYSIEHAGS